MINLSPHSYTLKRSKIFPVILVMSALAAETALASWFPQRVGRRMSRMTPASVGAASAAATQRRRTESQIHRVWGRPFAGNIRPPVIVLQKESANWQRHRLRDRQTDRQTDIHTYIQTS